MKSPTQRSLELLFQEGWEPQVVERWKGPRRIDLFGIGDIIAICGNETLLIQATTGSNHAARRKKALDCEIMHADGSKVSALPLVTAAGWRFEIWSWRKDKNAGRWVVRREMVTCDA